MPEARTQGGGNGLLVAGLVLAGGYLVFTKVIQPDIITPVKTAQYVQRIGVQVTGVKLTQKSVIVNVKLENPNVTPLTLNAIVGNVFIGSGKTSYKLGSLSKYGPVIIKPTSETTQSAEVKISALNQINFFRYFSDLLAGKIKGQTVLFLGTVTVNGRPFPVKESYRLA